MKILHLSTDDIRPGAARAAYRLNQNLRSIGVNSEMLVQTKQSDDQGVIGLLPNNSVGKITTESRKFLDKLPFVLYPDRDRAYYSLQWLPTKKIISKVAQLEPDLINLHWIGDAYIPIEAIAKFRKPLVWSLRDMWSFTGGCHYSQECDRYTHSCGACPQLHSNKERDLSRWVWKRKANAWKNLDLTIVSLSSWLAKCASSSPLFKDLRIEVIPNGLDTNRYKPFDQRAARELLNLPQDKQLILFGAVNAVSDKRKGFYLLQPALQNLSSAGWQDRVELVVFGSSQPDNSPDFGFKAHYLGKLSDDLSLNIVYSAADVLVAPSTQENLANTVLEAIACGTPCVAFKIGGMPDLIEHQKNGYLAKPLQVEDLAQGLAWVLDNQERHQKLSHRAREKTEQEFTMEVQARQYLSLFKEILNERNYQKLR